jgi:hypothetical protein
MKKIKVCELKKGYGVNHSKYGYLQYRGLATKNPFTKVPKIPNEYIFWPPVDQNGNTVADIVIKNGNKVVELVEGNEDDD